MLLITLCSVVLLAIGFVWMMFDMKKQSASVSGIMPPTALLDVGNRQILVEIAGDDASRTRGLSYRDSLDPDRGMYFMFTSSTVQYFWMYQMKFPLDIIFINDERIVSVLSNVPNPKGMLPPTIVNSHVPANRVLEVNAGKAAEWGIKEGSVVGLAGPSD
jgi:uncharacterized protein